MARSSTAADAGTPSPVRAFFAGLGPRERRSLVGMTAVVVALHVIGFGVLFLAVAPQHFALGGEHAVFTVGVGLLAYTFGLRHAFDADHIAAVDNTTRKLLADRAEMDADASATPPMPLSVGFWFSLGHSTVVFVLAFLLALGIRSLVGPVSDDDSTLQTITHLIGPTVSGVFLLALGIVNLLSLVAITRVFRRMRRGDYDEAELERHLHSRGVLNRLLGGLTRSIRAPWQIYPVGVLFGLGFDTATEIALLTLAGGSAALNLPFYAVLVLPVLFAAGMSLMDTADGVFMNAAYGWAFSKPVRKVYYNVTVTSLSVAVALVIGTIELVGVLSDRLGITSGPIAAVGSVPLDSVGYIVVAMFVVTWAAAVIVWRVGRVEERWAPVAEDSREA